MNPMIPPPVPACHGFAVCAVMGAASASMNMDSCRSRERAKFIIVSVLVGLKFGVWSLVERNGYFGRGGERWRVL